MNFVGIPFSMNNAVKVAGVAWVCVYFFKIDHRNGYQHVPIQEDSWKYFEVFWKGTYYVLQFCPLGGNQAQIYTTPLLKLWQCTVDPWGSYGCVD